MSDDVKRALIMDEVCAIIEDAIEKISRIVPSQSPDADDRKLAADIIYTCIVKTYFPERAAPNFLDRAGAISGAHVADAMEAIVRGEVAPALLRAAQVEMTKALGVEGPSIDKAMDGRLTVLAYKEHRKRGMSKAEFVRRLIKYNLIIVPKAERKGIRSTNFNNVYRELGRLLRRADKAE